MRQRAANVSDMDVTAAAADLPGDAAPVAPVVDRRAAPRVAVRAAAELSGATGTTVVQTRHASPAGAGFVSATAVTPSAAAHRFRLRLADGQIVDVACTVERGQPDARGLFEGYAKFDHPVDVFSHKRIRPKVA